jgi:hypothetical protein
MEDVTVERHLQVQGVVEDLAAFGLPIWVTELDWSGSSQVLHLHLCSA